MTPRAKKAAAAKSRARNPGAAPAIEFTAAEIVMRAIDELKPFPNNPKIHTSAQVTALADNITAFGFDQPILIDENDTILKGHGRQLGARKAGLTLVPTIVRAGLSDDDKWAIVISDNALPAMTGFDQSLLRVGLTQLAKVDYPLHLTGFDNVRLATFGVGLSAEQHQPDVIPEAPKRPVTKPGNLWIMGDHRLICGDCRDENIVEQLLNGNEINLAFTSPPYAEQREYDKSSGFKPVPPEDYVEWFSRVAANVKANLADDGSWFVNIKPSADGLDTSLYVMDLVVAHVRQWGWHFATEFCWDRNGVPKAVTQRFKNQFEPIYQFVRGRWKMRPNAVRHESDNVPRAGGKGVGQTSWGGKQGGAGSNSVSGSFGGAKKRRNGTSEFMSDVQGNANDVGEYIGPGLAYPGNRLPTFTASHDAMGHAAAFPVGLPEFFCKAYTDAGDIVYDPFCGSGSTLIAAHKTDRAGFGCEISPAYCDIIVHRWQTFAKAKAVLQGTKKTFDQVEKERRRKA
jgi:DNA modification methylase